MFFLSARTPELYIYKYLPTLGDNLQSFPFISIKDMPVKP